jgi:hypothetical protein
MSYIDTEELQAEIDEMANDIIDALLRKTQECRAYFDKSIPNDVRHVGIAVHNLVDVIGASPLNRYENKMIEALTFVISRQKEIAESTILEMLKHKMGVQAVEHICRADYTRAQNFLLDMLSSPIKV